MAYLLHQLLTEAAAALPDAEAIRFRGDSISYRELDDASNCLARALIDAGIRPGDRVAIQLARGFEQWISVYGALKAGAAFVPIDPSLPPTRAARILADCAVEAIVTTSLLGRAALASTPGDAPRLAVLVDDGSDPATFPIPTIRFEAATRGPDASDPQVPVIDLDLAWIVYTSGSTGTPKGVALSHRALLTFTWAIADVMLLRPGDRTSGFTPLHFSLSACDLFPPLVGRATVILVPEEDALLARSLERSIREELITVWCSVPSALRLLLQGGLRQDPFPYLRQLWFGGEVFPVKDLAELRRRIPHAEFIHIFGGGESMGRMFHRVVDVPLDRPTVPLGRPFPNTKAIILKEDGTPAGVGEVGELFMRSSMLMRGYWGDPEKTAKVLVPDPSCPEPADRVCATGDLVRLLPDGLYEFAGRKDDQIKARGVRIELGDIDAALRSHPDVAEAACVALADERAGTMVVACVVPVPGRALSEDDVARHVREQLPPSMVPSRTLFVGYLPTNSNGKLDRPSLRETVATMLGGA